MKVRVLLAVSIAICAMSCWSQQNVPCKCQEGQTQISCNVCAGKGTTGKCLGQGCNAGKVKGPAVGVCRKTRYSSSYYSYSVREANSKCGCANCAIPCGTCEGTGQRACLKCKRSGMLLCSRETNRNHVDPKHSVQEPKEVATDLPLNDQVIEQLKKLKSLKEEGILTEEEYDLKRKKLVDKLNVGQ